MDNVRDRINQLLRDNHSFQHGVDEALARTYPRAHRTAAMQTGLPLLTFPADGEWAFVQLMNEDLWL
jgi:hypothetical protein